MPDNIDVIIAIIIVLMGAETRFITNDYRTSFTVHAC